jgi:threonylcarbamoyladenosine tRNA methylthiotransferase MtaB
LNGYRLAHLIRDLEKIDELYRVRISSIEASEIDDELIEVLGQSSKVCKHLHIPLQAGHNQVLKKMNRHYTVEEFAAKLEKLRRHLPDLAITSDVIVGFPGETDEYFEATEAFIREQKFSQLHVFPYSPRKGTPAAKFKEQVDERIKEERVHRLIELSHQLTRDYAETFLNLTLEVIPESPLHEEAGEHPVGRGPNGEAGFWLQGTADNYLRVAFQVPDGIRPEDLIGEVCQIRVTGPSSELQVGEFVRQITEREEDDVVMECAL